MKHPQQVFVEPVSPRSSSKGKNAAVGCLGGLFSLLFFVLRFFPLSHNTPQAPQVPRVDQAYFDALGQPIDESGPTMGALLDLYTAVQAKASALQTPDWQAKAKAAYAALDSEGRRMEDITPVPPDCLQMRKDAVLTGQQMCLVATTFAKGANPHQPDMRLLAQATQNFDEITKTSQTLADDSNKIRVKYGVKSTEPDRVKAGK